MLQEEEAKVDGAGLGNRPVHPRRSLVLVTWLSSQIYYIVAKAEWKQPREADEQSVRCNVVVDVDEGKMAEGGLADPW